MPLLRSIRVQLTLWYVLLLAITLGLFCAGLYVALRLTLYQNLRDSLEARTEIISSLATQNRDFDVELIGPIGDPTEGEEFARVYDYGGDLVLDNTVDAKPIPEDFESIDRALSGQPKQRSLVANGHHLRVLAAPIIIDGDVVGVVEVGLENDVRETLRTLIIVMAIAYPVALIIASGGGVFLAGRALSPIDALTRHAQRITAEDLSQRLGLKPRDDEVGRLASTFDQMIGRLDDSFRRQQRFTADASHELRTPLTAIKGQADVALQKERTPDAYKQVLVAINTEADRMIRLVSSLLTLARADAARAPIARERVSLNRVVSSAVEHVMPAAEQKGIRLEFSNTDNLATTGDADLLLQLVLNLLDNAIKHTPPQGVVNVTCAVQGRSAIVDVRDSGPGISAEHLPHIFERFYRADGARSREEGGAGLGLSISRWIAEAHGGSILAESSPGQGSRFTVQLPLS